MVKSISVPHINNTTFAVMEDMQEHHRTVWQMILYLTILDQVKGEGFRKQPKK